VPGPTLQRQVLVDWRKDVGRSIDYLETRDDIDKTRIAYLGVSQGSAYGVILAALEDRFKAVVLLDGGMFQQTTNLAGLDQVDFAPRLTKPVLMVNGRYDATFPHDSAQLPLFRMLGTPAADKRHVVFDTPHLRATSMIVGRVMGMMILISASVLDALRPRITRCCGLQKRFSLSAKPVLHQNNHAVSNLSKGNSCDCGCHGGHSPGPRREIASVEVDFDRSIAWRR